MNSKKQKEMVKFIERCAGLTAKDMDLIAALNVKETLQQLSEHAKKILEMKD